MQATCSQCSHKVVVDDAKAPDRAFIVKCPKCQTPVKFAGKVAGAVAPGPVSPAAATIVPGAELPPSASGAGAVAGSGETDQMRAGMMAQLRREMGLAAGSEAGMRALVALADAAQANAIAHTLTRQGFAVDGVEDPVEAARLLEQGVYGLVVTSRTVGTSGKETILQRIGRLNPEGRRRVFVVLVGDEFKTGDGTQAFAVMADLVLSSRDAAAADAALRNTMSERTRLYQMFADARRRFEASAG